MSKTSAVDMDPMTNIVIGVFATAYAMIGDVRDHRPVPRWSRPPIEVRCGFCAGCGCANGDPCPSCLGKGRVRR